MTAPPGLSPEALSARSLNLLKVLGNVAEDLADDRAQEEQGDDHDDRDEGEQQAVLDERLTFLVFPMEASEKSADELKHVLQVPPFLTGLAKPA